MACSVNRLAYSDIVRSCAVRSSRYRTTETKVDCPVEASPRPSAGGRARQSRSLCRYPASIGHRKSTDSVLQCRHFSCTARVHSVFAMPWCRCRRDPANHTKYARRNSVCTERTQLWACGRKTLLLFLSAQMRSCVIVLTQTLPMDTGVLRSY